VERAAPLRCLTGRRGHSRSVVPGGDE
jgi:hypothetical protein